MSEIISKELLSEVLKRDCNISHLSVNDLIYEEITTEDRYIGLIGINIHELAHKCKEWAYEQGYHIFVYRVRGHMFELLVTDNSTDCQNSNLYDRVSKDKRGINMHSYEIPTEPEAIFKACQWILENKGDRNWKRKRKY